MPRFPFLDTHKEPRRTTNAEALDDERNAHPFAARFDPSGEATEASDLAPQEREEQEPLPVLAPTPAPIPQGEIVKRAWFKLAQRLGIMNEDFSLTNHLSQRRAEGGEDFVIPGIPMHHIFGLGGADIRAMGVTAEDIFRVNETRRLPSISAPPGPPTRQEFNDLVGLVMALAAIVTQEEGA